MKNLPSLRRRRQKGSHLQADSGKRAVAGRYRRQAEGRKVFTTTWRRTKAAVGGLPPTWHAYTKAPTHLPPLLYSWEGPLVPSYLPYKSGGSHAVPFLNSASPEPLLMSCNCLSGPFCLISAFLLLKPAMNHSLGGHEEDRGTLHLLCTYMPLQPTSNPIPTFRSL